MGFEQFKTLAMQYFAIKKSLFKKKLIVLNIK